MYWRRHIGRNLSKQLAINMFGKIIFSSGGWLVEKKLGVGLGLGSLICTAPDVLHGTDDDDV